MVRQIRTAGGTEALSAALDDWRRRLTARGVSMLGAAAQLRRVHGPCGRPGPDRPGRHGTGWQAGAPADGLDLRGPVGPTGCSPAASQ